MTPEQIDEFLGLSDADIRQEVNPRDSSREWAITQASLNALALETMRAEDDDQAA